jgi:hypothetical protein
MNQGQWIRTANNGLNVVFIHGINSSEECWRHENGSYWPKLLKDEGELADIGIYVFSYRTGINTGFYSLSDIVDSLREYFRLDNLLSSSGIIFVCHSMGGIVVRRFLVNQQSDLIEKNLKLGLFLVASPSLGSEYANMLNLISSAMGHTQASALKFSQNNVWLNDLDKDFINLINGKLQIKGKELIEDLPLYGKGFIRRQIVEPFSGAKYFGNSFKVPGSDHITIATPVNRESVQHRLLIQFISDFEDLFNSGELNLVDETRTKKETEILATDKNVKDNEKKFFARCAISQAMTMVFVDLMRLLYVAYSDAGRAANYERYPVFIDVAEQYFSDLRSHIARFSVDLDTQFHEISLQLERRLSWILGRIKRGLDLSANDSDYFNKMQQIGQKLYEFCSNSMGEKYEYVVNQVDKNLSCAIQDFGIVIKTASLDDVLRLRFYVQSQLLESNVNADGSKIYTIADDMDLDFGVYYFVLDQKLLDCKFKQLSNNSNAVDT